MAADAGRPETGADDTGITGAAHAGVPGTRDGSARDGGTTEPGPSGPLQAGRGPRAGTDTSPGSGTSANTSMERLIEETLLGGATKYNRQQVSARAGVEPELATRIWQALGFPEPPGDATVFTEEDADALHDINDLLDHEFVDEAMVLDLARAVGQTMGRLASWLGDVWLRRLADHMLQPGEPGTDETVAAALLATRELRPTFEHLMIHGWRRQIAAVGLRAMANTAAATADPASGTAWVLVGFADVVSFTRQSRRMDGQSLAEFVERFEQSGGRIVTEHGGRVIKTLGDEILFVADNARAAAGIALGFTERGANDASFPQVRVGLAAGEVILRHGDVFGTPVNLAARLTSVAYPGSVLVDTEFARAMEGDPAFETKGLHQRPLQGLGRVRPWVLRRAQGGNGSRPGAGPDAGTDSGQKSGHGSGPGSGRRAGHRAGRNGDSA